MEKTFREKIALVVFAVLIVVSGIVLIGYFSTGRSWTIAATFVDDTVGEMDGYSVILFNGVLDPTTSKDEDGSHPDTVEDGADPAVDDASGSSGKAPDSVYGVDSGADAFLETKDGLSKMIPYCMERIPPHLRIHPSLSRIAYSIRLTALGFASFPCILVRSMQHTMGYSYPM